MATTNNSTLAVTSPIQHKRGTSAMLEASNYVPAAGELVLATDTGEIRGGNGIDLWRDLPSGIKLLNKRLFDAETTHEVVMSVILTEEQVQQKYIEMPEACDTNRIIRVYLHGIPLKQGIDWEVSVRNDVNKILIAWDGYTLEDLLHEADKLLISYFERM